MSCKITCGKRIGKEKEKALELWVILSLAEKEKPEKFEKEQSGRQQEISVAKKVFSRLSRVVMYQAR